MCDSITADILFLSNSLIQPIMKMHGIGLVEQLFRERRLILNKTLDNIDEVASKIAGLGLDSYSRSKKQDSEADVQASPEASPNATVAPEARTTCINHRMPLQDSLDHGEHQRMNAIQLSKVSMSTTPRALKNSARKAYLIQEQVKSARQD